MGESVYKWIPKPFNSTHVFCWKPSSWSIHLFQPFTTLKHVSKWSNSLSDMNTFYVLAHLYSLFHLCNCHNWVYYFIRFPLWFRNRSIVSRNFWIEFLFSFNILKILNQSRMFSLLTSCCTAQIIFDRP